MKLKQIASALVAVLALALNTGVAHAAITPSGPPPAGAMEIGPDFTVVAIDGPKWTVYYGVGKTWGTLTGSGLNVLQCAPATFGGDPAPGVAKKCFATGHTNGAYSCAVDFKNCAHTADGRIVYGVPGKVVAIDVKGNGSVACQPTTFKSDPAPGVLKNCFFMAQTPAERAAAAPSGTGTVKPAATAATPETKDKAPKTPTDPVQWVVDQAKKRNKIPAAVLNRVDSLLSPTKGVFLIEQGDEDEEKEKDPGAIVSVKGQFNWVRGFAATQGATGRLLRMGRNVSRMAKALGVAETVPLTVTLFYKGNELDLEFSFGLMDTFKITGDLVPIAKTRMAYKTLALKLHAKLASTTPEFSVELEGDGYGQATSRDPWVALTPAVELSNEGEVTFGGTFSGACSGEPTKDTKGENCKGDWDVFKMGRITAKGGSLRITVEGDVPKGLEATILNGRLGAPGRTGNIEVTGAIRSEVKLKPGFGLVLKTRGTPSLRDFLYIAYGPFLANAPGGNTNPMNVLVNGLSKLPNPNLPLSQQADIIITPTGFILDSFNYPEPQVFIKAQAAAAGIQIDINSNIKGDVDKIMAGDIKGGLPKGYFTMSENNTGFNDGLKSVASNIPGGGTAIGFIMDHGFKFNSVSATVTIDGLKHDGKGSITYTLGGVDRSFDDIPLDTVSDPTALPKYFLDTMIRNLTDPPEWLKKIPGLGDAAVAAGQALRAVVGAAGVVAGEVKAVAGAAVDAIVSLFRGGGRDNSQDLLNKHVSPFGAPTLVITCATEGQACRVDGTQTVSYGVDTRVITRTVTGAIACNTSTFGGDPAPGTQKTCFWTQTNPPQQFSVMCAREGGRCEISGTNDIAYGAGDRVVILRGVQGAFNCTIANFGFDPAPGSTKGCYYKAANLTGIKCAEEAGTCNIPADAGPQDVYYGGADTYAVATCQTGPVKCDNATFGRDPAQALHKACYRTKSTSACSTGPTGPFGTVLKPAATPAPQKPAAKPAAVPGLGNMSR